MDGQEVLIGIVTLLLSVIWHIFVAVCLFKLAFPETFESLFGYYETEYHKLITRTFTIYRI